MNKFLVKIDSINDIYPSLKLGYILGITNYSVCFNDTFSINEVKMIRNEYPNITLFASLNRSIFNYELEDYKEILFNLDKLGLDGIIVGDIAAFTYNLKTNIILDQMHLNNSYLSINHYYNNGASGVVLTNDITLDEINEIRNNTQAILFKQVFGHAHMSTSVRKFVTNYSEHINKNVKENVNYIKEEKQNDYYIITEDYFGTHILDNKVLNLFDYKDMLDVNYFIIDNYLINKEITKKIVMAYLNNDKKTLLKACEDYELSEGFINRNTMYKVKNYE